MPHTTVEKEKAIIAIDEDGILEEDVAQKILERHRGVINNPTILVDFQIGPKVLATLPEFWQVLLAEAILGSVRDIENKISEIKTTAEYDLYFDPTNGRWDVTFRHDSPEPSLERHKQCRAIAHRFTGVIAPYTQYLQFMSLAWRWTHRNRPVEADRMRILADKYRGGIAMGFGGN